MESKFDMEYFEHSLKQHADQFSMIPSKRVWSGVYNSLHPGSKWPSLSMFLFFLLTLIGIGPLNNSSRNYLDSTLPDNSKNSVSDENETTIFQLNTFIQNDETFSTEPSVGIVRSLYTHLKKSPKRENFEPDNGQYIAVLKSNSKVSTDLNIGSTSNNKAESASQVKSESDKIIHGKISMINTLDRNAQKEKGGIFTGGIDVNKSKENKEALIVFQKNIELNENLLNSLFKSNQIESLIIQIDDFDSMDLSNSSKQTIESAKLSKKANRKTTWIFYITPAITSTYFKGNSFEGNNMSLSSSPLVINPNQIGNTMRYNARLGLNVGTEMNFEIADGWEIVSGAQLSYSGYNIMAHKVHPTFSYLYIRDASKEMIPKKYITFYGSGLGLDEAVLHNNSIQLAIPVGIKHSVYKNNKVEIKIGTTIQPSLILKSQSYILSADGRNYVTDPELMRTANVSGEFNSSISFQGDKIKWHVGPTIRYQALSSYKDNYPVKEHLVDYGIRIGISK
ncbi:MAG: hypothetical protein ABIN48_04605 [Ginsengibacter sp.]